MYVCMYVYVYIYTQTHTCIRTYMLVLDNPNKDTPIAMRT